MGENKMNTSKIKIRKELIVLGITAMLGTVLLVVGHSALGRTEFAQNEAQLIGDWTGDSICRVKNSPCHDEKVIYHIAKGSDPDHLTISADKIVDAKTINMGTGDYTYNRGSGTLLNETEGRIWKFTIKGNTMEGTLTMPDKTVFRHVTLTKKNK
jgi:hypothetical protein